MTRDRQIGVLVVEDEAVVNELVQNQLARLGYTVCGVAFDGAEAVTLACELQPDVVLMDLQMPDPDTGRDDTLAGLRAAYGIQEQCPTPVILLTAHESDELVRMATEAGIGAYLVKPVMGKDLDRAIIVALARFKDLMELRRLNADLRVRNEELDAFAHTVAHDLKSPLVNLIGYAELLEEDHGDALTLEVVSCLQSISKSGRKMDNIIEELLLLAGVRQTESVDIEPLEMSTILEEARQRLTDLIQSYRAEIVLPASWPAALGYGPWIEEVWVNYLSNAIKYGGRPPRVEVGATEEPEGLIRFWVRDNGLGMTAEEQARLFQPFTRLDQVRVKGYGLGLSIVRRIIERLAGQVGVESQVGSGSTFSFTLPAVGRPG
jgi:two-component system, sensor histidine kinase and response regulator